MLSSRKMTEMKRTGRSARRAKPGRRARTSMPMLTGTSTTANTCSTLVKPRLTVRSSAMNVESAKPTMSGS